MNYKKMMQTLSKKSQQAAEQGLEVFEETLDRLGPYVTKAGAYVKPKVKEATTFAAQQFETWQPRLDEAVSRISPALVRAVDKVSPAVEEALSRVAPALETAKDKVQEELVPSFTEALQQAAHHPVAMETSARLAAATSALRGELRVPEPEPEVVAKKKPVIKVVGAIAIGVAAAAAIAMAVKTFLTPSDWEAHQPSDAYIPEEPEPEAAEAAETGNPDVAASADTTWVPTEELDD